MRIETRNKLMASAAAVTMAATMLAPLASAESTFSYTPVAGGTFDFNKYLVMERDAYVPNTTFRFTIAHGTKLDPVAGTSMEVLEGLGTPTISSAVFAATDTTKAEADTLHALVAARPLAATEKYALHTVTVDFSSINFPEPGIYRYVVTEQDNTEPGVVIDEKNIRTLDVYVTDNGSGTLSVEKYVLHKDNHNSAAVPAITTYGSDGAEVKSDGYINEYVTKDITVGKTVTGNQASRDKYFKFTVKLTNVGAGNKFDVDLADAQASIAANPNSATKGLEEGFTNPALLTADANGAIEQIFWLQHDQSIKIHGIPMRASYEITEDQEDYKQIANAAGTFVDSQTNLNDAASGKIGDTKAEIADKAVGFTNQRQGNVPTGVLLSIAPFAGAAVAGAAGVLAFAKKNKKDDEE
jgi:pilin isopeptide linkage protein